MYRISITAATIQLLLDAHERLGPAYGSSDEQIIAEGDLNGHQLQVCLRQDTEGWTLLVRGTPPFDAIVSLFANQQSQHQWLSAAGVALFAGVPEVWLRTGFDVVVTLPAPSH